MYFVAQNDKSFSIQLTAFAAALPAYATLLGFSTDELKETTTDAAYMNWVVNCRDMVDNFELEWSKFSKAVRKASLESTNVLTPPTLPTLPAMPALVQPGIQDRFTQKAAKAKSNINCTTAIQEKLGIAALHTTAEHLTPDLKIKYSAGYPEISFHRFEHQAINLYKDKGDGQGYGKPFKTLMKSPFTDTELPAVGTSAVFKYKAVYIDNNIEVGNFSAEQSVLVTGRV
jgi:hypothetical protein